MGYKQEGAVLEMPDPKDGSKTVLTPEGKVVRAWKITAGVLGAIAGGLAIALIASRAKARAKVTEETVIVGR